jgi:hypothetical protein
MYTTTIGKTFLKAYNDKFNKNHNAKSFFEDVFVPLFFDHPKYLMTAGRSPIENPKISWEDMIKGKKEFETPERRKERINKMIKKIENEPVEESIAQGYPVLSPTAPTTSQVSNIKTPSNKEDVYNSWIGAALGVGVKGGINILFDNDVLLLDIFEGWKHYREYLNKNNELKGNQINTWNGNWISHRYDGYEYDEDDPIFGMNPLQTNNKGLLEISTISWVKVLIRISEKLNSNMIIGYLYNIGQTNTTIGFIPFNVPELNRPNLFYKKIFGETALEKDRNAIESLYGTAFGFRSACELGSIGVNALEPKGLKAYLPGKKNVKKVSIKSDDNEQQITFNTYLIWILAMMNNEKLWDLSRDFAQKLLDYRAGAEKGRKNRDNDVNSLLESASNKQFLQNLIPIVEEAEKVDDYEELGKFVNTMPKDNFPYFNTLIRFQYALLNK